MGACGAASFGSFLFFKETFRTERSLAWQKARKEALERVAAGESVPTKSGVLSRFGESISTTMQNACKKIMTLFKWKRTSTCKENITAEKGGMVAVPNSPFVSPLYQEPGHNVNRTNSMPIERMEKSSKSQVHRSKSAWAGTNQEKRSSTLTRKVTSRRSVNRVITSDGREVKFRPKLSDVSPLGSAIAVVKQPHNIVCLFYSGLAFASQYSLSYTATRTFSRAPYNFSPILIGVVLLALGIGGMAGSILGGRLSDRALRIGSKKLGGQRAPPELRIMSVRLPMILCPITFVGYAWSAHYKTNIAIPIVCLVLLGFSLFWIYSAALTYLVDSNTGRSSGAVACNSALRGLFAFIASEVAGPLQDAVGDGPLYTGWAILLVIGQVGLLTVGYKGQEWRDPSWKWPQLSFCGRNPRNKRQQSLETE